MAKLQKLSKITKQQQDLIWQEFFNNFTGLSLSDLNQESVAKHLSLALKTVLAPAFTDFSPASVTLTEDQVNLKNFAFEVVENENWNQILPIEGVENTSPALELTDEEADKQLVESFDPDKVETVEEEPEPNEDEEASQPIAESEEQEESSDQTEEKAEDISKPIAEEQEDPVKEQAHGSSTKTTTTVETIEEETEDTVDDKSAANIVLTKEIEEEIDKEVSSSSSTTYTKKFFLFDFESEQLAYNIIKNNPIWLGAYDYFFTAEKKIFPYIKGKISLFGLYIIKYLIDLMPNKDAINSKYTINIETGNDRAPAVLSQLWDEKAKGLNFTVDKKTNYIYFNDLTSADKLVQAIKNSNKRQYIDCNIVKDKTMPLVEEPYEPINNKNILSYPYFCFGQNPDTLKNLSVLEDFMHETYKTGPFKNKPYIRCIKYDEWTKTKWLKYFEYLIKLLPKVLTKDELYGHSFEKAEQVYERFTKINNLNEIKLFIVHNLDLTPEGFNELKYKKAYCSIYNLIYSSWIKFLIKPQPQTQTIEQYDYNLYSFIANTKIFNTRSHFLFRFPIFVPYVPYIRPLPEVKKDQAINIKKDTFYIKEIKNFGFDLNQLDYIFEKHNINWLNYSFISKTLNSLVENEFIEIIKDKIYISRYFTFYYDMLKKQNLEIFFSNVSFAFDSYFTKDIKSFIEKLQIINKKPF